MWHILVRLVDGCREIWGSCAIYVGIPSLILANELELRHLCPKKAAWCWEKKWGETSAVQIFHLGSLRKTDPTKCQVSFGKLRKKNWTHRTLVPKFRVFEWGLRDIDGATQFIFKVLQCNCKSHFFNIFLSKYVEVFQWDFYHFYP